MIELIRNYIGKMTLPKDAFEDNGGDFWIEVSGLPTGEYSLSIFHGYREMKDYSHEFNYQKLEQNFFGVWKPVFTYYGTDCQLSSVYPDSVVN